MHHELLVSIAEILRAESDARRLAGASAARGTDAAAPRGRTAHRPTATRMRSRRRAHARTGAAHRRRNRKIVGLLDSAVKDGAEILCGGKRGGDTGGYFFEPTVVGNCRQDMDIVQKEIFGPVIPIVIYDELEEAKLSTLGYTLVRPATPEEIAPIMGAKPGSLGAVKGTIAVPAKLDGIYADHAIKLIGNGTTGANEDGFHLRNVNVARDLAITAWGDFRSVKAGEPCPTCGAPLKSRRGIEVGRDVDLVAGRRSHPV